MKSILDLSKERINHAIDKYRSASCKIYDTEEHLTLCLHLSTTLELSHLCKFSAESGAIYVIHGYTYGVNQCLGRRNKA